MVEASTRSPWVTPRAFGARCDGATDDTAALVAAGHSVEGTERGILVDCRLRIVRAAGPLRAPLRFEPGGAIDTSGGGSVTISGDVEAPLASIFAGAGVTFAARAARVYPQWWGAAGDGAHDDTTAIQAAIDASLRSGCEVVLPSGYYLVTSTVNVGRPEWDGYGFIVGRTARATDPMFRSHARSANIASNASLLPVTIRFAENAYLVASFTPPAPTPVLAYNLEGSSQRTGRILNAKILGRGSFSRGAYAPPPSGVLALNNLIGMYVSRGVKVLERAFVSSVQYGIVSANAYWTRVTDVFCEAAGGDCLNIAQGNALVVDNVIMSSSGRGLVFDGAASELRGIHSEQVGQDLVVLFADACTFGPAYLEDVSASDGADSYALTLGTRENGLDVLESTFIGIRIGSVRPHKRALRVWGTRAATFIGSRTYGHGTVTDANSYGTTIGCDFDIGGSRWISVAGEIRAGGAAAARNVTIENHGTSGGSLSIKDSKGATREAMYLDGRDVLTLGGPGIDSLAFNVPARGLCIPTSVTLEGAPRVTPDPSRGIISVNVRNDRPMAIDDPVGGVTGQTITIEIVNRSRGAMGLTSWGPKYRLAPWVSPAAGHFRTISFRYDGQDDVWREIGRSTVDIAN